MIFTLMMLLYFKSIANPVELANAECRFYTIHKEVQMHGICAETLAAGTILA